MDVTLKKKVDFLKLPSSYGVRPEEVVAIETHVSWVFLVANRVFKLKKPVRFPFLDFTTLSARAFDCREEVRLNKRLAPGIYLGVVPLRVDEVDRLRLGGKEGQVVDWLVEMRQLPADRMLDDMLSRDAVETPEIDRLATRLAEFYLRTKRARIAPPAYVQRFRDQLATNERTLTSPEFSIDYPRIRQVLDRLRMAISELRPALEERAGTGKIVEAHGDLRPEHICFTEPIAIFDCLEFDRQLRLLDPMDELAFLGMECTMIGAPWLGPELAGKVAQAMEDNLPEVLFPFYAAFRAILRAKLTLSHLIEGDPRSLTKWEPLTDRYTKVADNYLSGAIGLAPRSF